MDSPAEIHLISWIGHTKEWEMDPQRLTSLAFVTTNGKIAIAVLNKKMASKKKKPQKIDTKSSGVLEISDSDSSPVVVVSFTKSHITLKAEFDNGFVGISTSTYSSREPQAQVTVTKSAAEFKRLIFSFYYLIYTL